MGEMKLKTSPKPTTRNSNSNSNSNRISCFNFLKDGGLVGVVLLIISSSLSLPLSLSGRAKAEAEATAAAMESSSPTPAPWPYQFHSRVISNQSGALQLIDLWYDWPNGRNLNIEQDQLGKLLYNIEWTNGTSFFFYPLEQVPTCFIAHFDVGILRPNWMEGGKYLGQRYADGFLCNVWDKADSFIQYYEDVVTKRPVHWLLFTGKESDIMTFDVGAVLEDSKWQAPPYCFLNSTSQPPLLETEKEKEKHHFHLRLLHSRYNKGN